MPVDPLRPDQDLYQTEWGHPAWLKLCNTQMCRFTNDKVVGSLPAMTILTTAYGNMVIPIGRRVAKIIFKLKVCATGASALNSSEIQVIKSTPSISA
ncbi:hypothetical protein [Nitrosomonas sp.]|uniref:hypothetical protein n=1 Tax=Nitrosomonas sp. TaxID=42353 RepID=UPI002607FF38|nr:hypothetical protein [Nitrosomonas sp.]